MASSSISFICCRSIAGTEDICINGHGTDCSGLNVTVTLDSVTTSSGFGMYNNAFLLSRSCMSVAFPPCISGAAGCLSGLRVPIQLQIGCFPASLFPIEVKYTIRLNGTSTGQRTLTYNSGSPLNQSCGNDCGEVCGGPGA